MAGKGFITAINAWQDNDVYLKKAKLRIVLNKILTRFPPASKNLKFEI